MTPPDKLYRKDVEKIKKRLSRAGDATTEIEITPEMIDAGKDVISSYWLDFTGLEGYLLR